MVKGQIVLEEITLNRRGSWSLEEIQYTGYALQICRHLGLKNTATPVWTSVILSAHPADMLFPFIH